MNEAQIMDWTDHQKADQTQFISLIDQYQATIGKICRLYKEDEEDRDKLFQEIVFQLWRSAAGCNEVKPGSWIYATALSTAIAGNILNPSKAADQQASPKVYVDHKEQLIHAIQQLTDDDKAIFTLYLEELSYPEIAEITGIAETVAGVKLNRIKKKIHQLVRNPKEQYPLKTIWKNIHSEAKSESALRSMITERSHSIFSILNNNISFLISKSMVKNGDIKRSLEDHLVTLRSFALLSVMGRVAVFVCLLLFAKFTIENTTVWYWTLAIAILLFTAHIALLSITWLKKIRQMKFTIDHLRIQKEYGRRVINDV